MKSSQTKGGGVTGLDVESAVKECGQQRDHCVPGTWIKGSVSTKDTTLQSEESHLDYKYSPK